MGKLTKPRLCNFDFRTQRLPQDVSLPLSLSFLAESRSLEVGQGSWSRHMNSNSWWFKTFNQISVFFRDVKKQISFCLEMFFLEMPKLLELLTKCGLWFGWKPLFVQLQWARWPGYDPIALEMQRWDCENLWGNSCNFMVHLLDDDL